MEKVKFFAQYYGTKTLYVGGVGLIEVGLCRGLNFFGVDKIKINKL